MHDRARTGGEPHRSYPRRAEGGSHEGGGVLPRSSRRGSGHAEGTSSRFEGSDVASAVARLNAGCAAVGTTPTRKLRIEMRTIIILVAVVGIGCGGANGSVPERYDAEVDAGPDGPETCVSVGCVQIPVGWCPADSNFSTSCACPAGVTPPSYVAGMCTATSGPPANKGDMVGYCCPAGDAQR